MLTEHDLKVHWDKVEKADRSELEAFITHSVFQCERRKANVKYNEVDAIWIRRWKQVKQADGTVVWVVKSRMRGRGFLDKQKHDAQ